MVPARVPVSRVVVEVRPVVYPRRKKVHWRPLAEDPKERWGDDSGGVGVETVREVRVCPGCAAAGAGAITSGRDTARAPSWE